MTSSMASALQKAAGYAPHEMQFYMAAQKFLGAGGNASRAKEIVDLAQNSVAGPTNSASANGGHLRAAGDGNLSRAGGGQGGYAAHHWAVPPAREPSQLHRRAAGSVAKVVAVTVLDTYKIRDGRAIGDVRYGELSRLALANAGEAALCRLLLKHAQASHDTRVRDFIKASDLNRLIQKAAEVADAS